ncbi:cyclohexanol dehydrogenase-like isoform X2 [Dermacentor andersoni]|uniref:cyclohexanol dehydrogenase-like isoform X2 n=1 Tax=Dermacentor andersoni TaxID=34620 RepID=UPI003B3BB9C5
MTADANVVGEEELGATWRYLAKSDLGTLENAPYGVRVNLIRSGYMKTTMIKPPTVSVEEHMEVMEKKTSAWHALERMGTPEEVAQCIAFLASDDATFVTGTTVPVDGGFLLLSRVSGSTRVFDDQKTT